MLPVVTIVDLNAGAPNQGVGALSELVRHAGGQPDVIDLRLGQRLPARPGRAVILTGGPGSPAESAPWRRRLEHSLPHLCRQVPVLGICLGFQVMAHAFGWRLGTLAHSRFAVTLLPAGTRADRLLPALPPGAGVFEQRSWGAWPQPGARGQILARGSAGDVLAVRFSPLAVGVVFHPEAAPGPVRHWLSTDAKARAKAERTSGPGAAERFVAHCAALSPTWERTVPGFLSTALRRGVGRATPPPDHLDAA